MLAFKVASTPPDSGDRQSTILDEVCIRLGQEHASLRYARIPPALTKSDLCQEATLCTTCLTSLNQRTNPQLLNLTLISSSENCLVLLLSISATSSLLIPICSPIGTKESAKCK